MSVNSAHHRISTLTCPVPSRDNIDVVEDGDAPVRTSLVPQGCPVRNPRLGPLTYIARPHPTSSRWMGLCRTRVRMGVVRARMLEALGGRRSGTCYRTHCARPETPILRPAAIPALSRHGPLESQCLPGLQSKWVRAHDLIKIVSPCFGQGTQHQAAKHVACHNAADPTAGLLKCREPRPGYALNDVIRHPRVSQPRSRVGPRSSRAATSCSRSVRCSASMPELPAAPRRVAFGFFSSQTPVVGAATSTGAWGGG